jgi:urea transport system substrate-binding protein
MGTAMLLKACGAPLTRLQRTAPAEGGEEAATVVMAKPSKWAFLHSLSGTMAISETTVVDAEKLAIKEINAAGGVLGQQIEASKKMALLTGPPLLKKLRS